MQFVVARAFIEEQPVMTRTIISHKGTVSRSIVK